MDISGTTAQPILAHITAYLVKTHRLAHRGLEEQGLDVLPVLLQEGNQEVDGQHSVVHQLVLSHLDVTDGDTQAKHLLQLELDGGLDFHNLVLQVVVVGDRGGELTGLGKTGTEQTGDLLDQSLGSKEGVVLLGELLDKLLVLVQLLQVVNGHELEADGLGLINVVLIGQNAKLHLGFRDIGKPF